MTTSAVPLERPGALGWWRETDSVAHGAFIGASLGWMLDGFDVMLYAMVLSQIIASLGLSKPDAGLLGSITLLSSAVGGFAFGLFADRWGRKRALMLSIFLYAVFTGVCGLAQSFWQLAVFRLLLGLGMGGEWASGAALVSESWPSAHREKAFGYLQSTWPIGYGAAAVVTAIVLPHWGWRAVFFVGVLPAFFTLWIQRRVQESTLWVGSRSRKSASAHRSADIFKGSLRVSTWVVTAMNSFAMFGWWGLNLWIPAYLSLPVKHGGVGLSTYATAGLVIAMQVGTWFGLITFGYLSDAFGRKKTYIAFLVAAGLLVPLYAVIRAPMFLLMLVPLVAFFGTGYFSGFGPLTAEIYPTAVRATAQGFTYNVGRVVSAVAPFALGTLAEARGFGLAFAVTSIAFLLAAGSWIWIPETKGQSLV